MSHTTALTVGGVAVDPVAANLFPARLCVYVRDGFPTLTLVAPGAALAALPDPYLGKAVTLSLDGTLVFSGDVVSCHPEFTENRGWVLCYQCLGIKHRGDRVPFTDDNTGLDSAGFNLQPDDPSYFGSRAGRTVGQILTTCLTMVGNATALNSQGIGNYTGLPSAPALPAATATDLAALTLIPPAPTYLGNEKLLAAVEGLLASWAPNTTLHVQPDGTLRFLDLRTFTPHTLTLDVDPILPTPLSRDWCDSYGRVLVRGQPWVEAVLASLSNGGLAEAFAHDGLTSAAAKTAWKDSDFQQSKSAKDDGSCTCPSTTTVTVTSADATRLWASNYWDQTTTGRHGWVFLKASSLGGAYTQLLSRRIVSNTALTAGGTSILTLDRPLPVTTYDSYQVYGQTGGASVVYRLYSVTNAGIAAKLANQFLAPVPFVLAGGDVATLTSFPTGSVLWSPASGTPGPPYSEAPLDFTVDPAAGTILFSRPTWELGRAAPADVRALLAVNFGTNQAVYPADVAGVPQYGGTVYSVEGRTETLTVTVDQWRDPGNLTAMQAYAQDLWDSVSGTVVEGSVTYLGLYSAALTMGQALTIAGNGYPVPGWAGLALAVLECEVEWSEDGGSDFVTRMRCSNRRAHLTAQGFLKPDRTGQELGGDFSPFAGLEQYLAGTVPDLGAGFAGALGAGMESLGRGLEGSLGALGAGLGSGVDSLGGGLTGGLGALGGGVSGGVGAAFTGQDPFGGSGGTGDAASAWALTPGNRADSNAGVSLSGQPSLAEHEAAEARRVERERAESARRNEAFGETTGWAGPGFGRG